MRRKFNLELVGFGGFYNTALGDFLDDQLDYDLKQLDDSLSILNICDFNCWQNINYKEYYKEIAERIMGKFLKETKNYMFDLIDLIPLDKPRVIRPASYNGYTDKIVMLVEVKERDYYKLVGYLSGNKLVDKIASYYDYFDKKLNLNINFANLTDRTFNHIFNFALIARLMENDYVYFHYDLKENKNKLDVREEIYDDFISDLEKETYYDIDFGYAEYINWFHYQRELRHALDRHFIEDEFSLHNQTLWDLHDFCIKNKKLVLKENKYENRRIIK